MLGDKNLKDSSADSNIAIKDNPFSMSYTKTTKLITALYMVTDIMDKDEPLRNKLRTLGTGVISDISLPKTSLSSQNSSQIGAKIDEILSFLDIAFAVGMISTMNSSILKKEFLELKQSTTGNSLDTTLENLFKREEEDRTTFLKDGFHSIGHPRTRIGVQKGSTLLKALSDKTAVLSDKKLNTSQSTNDFNILKQQRRDEILKIIKDKGEVNITDIKNLATGVLSSAGEKTLQRELVSMVKDNILGKNGEKRWSRYFILASNKGA